MPKAKTTRRARALVRRKKSPSTRAGEFVREEIDEIRAGKHGAKNTKQAIAIGLSKARRAGVEVGENPRAKTKRTSKAKSKTRRATSPTSKKRRARVSLKALVKEPRAAVSSRALSRHAKAVARRRK